MNVEKSKFHKSAIRNPATGLLSITGAGLIAMLISEVNIHGLSGIIWAFSIFGFGFLLPILLLIKSIDIIKVDLKNDRSTIKTYSTILTSILGVILLALILTFAWTVFTN